MMILNGLFDCNLDSELCEMKAAAGTVISVSTGWSGVLKKSPNVAGDDCEC